MVAVHVAIAHREPRGVAGWSDDQGDGRRGEGRWLARGACWIAIAQRGPRDVAAWSMVASRRGGRSNASPMPPLGAFRSPLVCFRERTEHYRTRCTRTEGRPGLGGDLATAFGTPRSEGSRSRWLEGSMGAGGPRSGAAAAAEGRAQDRPRQTETGRAASGVRRVSAAGLIRRTWPFPVGGMLVGRNPATPKNRLISNRN